MATKTTAPVAEMPSRKNGYANSEFITEHRNFDGTMNRFMLALTNNVITEANKYYYGVLKDFATKTEKNDPRAWITELLFEKMDELMKEYQEVGRMQADLKDLRLALRGETTCPKCSGRTRITKRVREEDGTITVTNERCDACNETGISRNMDAVNHVLDRMVAKHGSIAVAKETLETGLASARFQY